MKLWFEQLLVPVPKKDKVDDSVGVAACDILANQIASSPKVSKLLEVGEKCGMEGSTIVMEILYMTM